MQTGYKAPQWAHVVRIVLTLVVLLVAGGFLRRAFLPDEFGRDGFFRPGAVEEEAAREVRYRASESCFECHPLMEKLHVAGIHKTVDCEVCHGPFADHVLDDAVYAAMPVVRGEEIKPMCLRCHNKIIQALPPESIKLVTMPSHLEDRKVRTDHVCNQCHHVHAPLKWVLEAREMVGLPLEKEGS